MTGAKIMRFLECYGGILSSPQQLTPWLKSRVEADRAPAVSSQVTNPGGIHAYRNLRMAVAATRDRARDVPDGAVYAIVRPDGETIIGEHGWTAAAATIIRIFVPPALYPYCSRALYERYRVPVDVLPRSLRSQTETETGTRRLPKTDRWRTDPYRYGDERDLHVMPHIRAAWFARHFAPDYVQGHGRRTLAADLYRLATSDPGRLSIRELSMIGRDFRWPKTRTAMIRYDAAEAAASLELHTAVLSIRRADQIRRIAEHQAALSSKRRETRRRQAWERPARQALGERCAIKIVPGSITPHLVGRGYHYETHGGQVIRHPSAYSKVGWSNMIYVASTRHIVVGEDWLRAAHQAATHA